MQRAASCKAVLPTMYRLPQLSSFLQDVVVEIVESKSGPLERLLKSIKKHGTVRKSLGDAHD